MICRIVFVLIVIKSILLAQGNDNCLKSYQLYSSYSDVILTSVAFGSEINSTNFLSFRKGANKFRQDTDEMEKSSRIRRIPGDIVTAGKIFVYDFIHVSSEPARWDRNDLMWAGGFAGSWR